MIAHVVLWLGLCLLFVSTVKFVEAVRECLEARRQDRRRASAHLYDQLAALDTEQQHRNEMARTLADIRIEQAQSIQRIYAEADRALFDIRQCGRQPR
ncbi:hypothetical protein [Mycobacteroides abscessus]|uniref:hypothetical protein n=1 Tax=Mycobacteroides abscessus TaxID=36809 RepID=UPI00232EEE09|nr:hypothetical protein [Mycobacteroides abscessus]MDB2210880.1 hypothetical protein [Mycobacteroides abscessus subsp. massiliense]MDB2233983.1 hypothetical protein [Mycobacteroides abscessus subsp. massiliense]